MDEYREVKNCPVCGKEGSQIPLTTVYGPDFVTPEGYRAAYKSNYVQCLYCDTSFQNPEPRMETFYSSGAYRKSLNMAQDVMDKDEQARAERIFQFLQKQNIKPDRFLDVGCSRGYLLQAVYREDGAECVGVDANPSYSYYPMFPVVTLDAVPSLGASFDLITCIHTLEHISNPEAVLRTLLSKLAPGGTLVVEVPNLVSSGGPYRFAHLTIFSTPGLRMLFQKVGLNVMNIQIGPDLLLAGKVR